MLSYKPASSDDMIAADTVDDIGILTITGDELMDHDHHHVDRDGSRHGTYAMQTIMVTVEAADTTLTAPSGVVVSPLC